jgi:tubulin-specific chaperone A
MSAPTGIPTSLKQKILSIGIRPKLIIAFILTGLIPLAIAGYVGITTASDALMKQSFHQLASVQALRKGQVEEQFKLRLDDVDELADSQRLLDLAKAVNLFARRMGECSLENFSPSNPEYVRLLRKFKKPLREYIHKFSYHNLFFITPNSGVVAFSLIDQGLLGTSIRHGEYGGNQLSHVWSQVVALRNLTVLDYSSFAPSQNMQSAFIGAPVIDERNLLTGVVVLQLGPKFVNHFMDSRQGMGQTGESYMLKLDQGTGRFYLRSNLRSMGDGRYVVGHELPEVLEYWKDAERDGHQGGHGLYMDSEGKAVLATYNQLDLHGLHWYLISKVDQEEITAPIRNIVRKTLGITVGLLGLIALLSLVLGRTITYPILACSAFANEIAQGRYGKKLRFMRRDELGQLALSLGEMSENLRQTHWMQTGKHGLDDAMRGETNLDNLSRRFISFMVKHLDAQLGAVYLNIEDMLHLRASYAFTDRDGNFSHIGIGEGMVGQAAFERDIIVFSNVNEDAPRLNYGAGETEPRHFMVVPLVHEDRLLGVFLVGSLHGFDALQKDFVRTNMANMGILFDMARSRAMIDQLLEQSRKQHEALRETNQELEEQASALKESEAELQAQQEELRVTNEELEEQTRALKESELALQTQQEELRVTNEELEERTEVLEKQKDAIRAKNTELVKAQEEIRQKARDLEIASKYKSEFLANMSHELRTPLNSILILSQLFARNANGNLTEKQVESAGAIHSSGTDLLNLINEILDLSKIEAGKVDLVIENTSLESLIADIRRIYETFARDKGLTFEITVDDSLPKGLHTDPQRLQQILRNLLTNAFKFTHQGTVALDITRPTPEQAQEAGLPEQEAVAFAIRDEGIGIPPEQQQAIFEAFQQADGSTSRRYGGTGLGLSISRELSKLLGGGIFLSSQEGRGSTFTIVLPVRFQEKNPPEESTEDSPHQTDVPAPDAKVESEGSEPEATLTPSPTAACDSTVETAAPQEHDAPPPDTTTQAAQVEQAQTNRAPAGQGIVKDDRDTITPDERSLLVIEDDTHFARIMRDFAHEHDFKCLVAEDGETGLHFADYYKPSAIILDIGLPGIDGWTVMERLKENPELRHIPVHFMSGSDSSLDAMRMGAVGFLTKPVSMEKIGSAFARIESIITKPVSKLLVVEDDPNQRESIRQLIGNGDVETTMISTGAEAYEELSKGGYDCMVLDLGLHDMSGFDLLEKIRNSETCSRVPVIVYTGRELTRKEDAELRQYAESIIIKGVKSPERLLEETALFLHRVESDLPEDKQRMLKLVHDKESVLGDKTVLLADDDMRNVFALCSVLQDKGMTTLIARNGQEALDKLREHSQSVDLVLMDIMMPQMDGYEAMRAIRKQSQYKRLPIIALTAKAMKGDRSKCIEAGANDYLAKPVNTDKLLSMLRVWLYS